MDDQMTTGDFAPFLTIETLLSCYGPLGLRLDRAEARRRLSASTSGAQRAAYLDWFDTRWPE